MEQVDSKIDLSPLSPLACYICTPSSHTKRPSSQLHNYFITISKQFHDIFVTYKMTQHFKRTHACSHARTLARPRTRSLSCTHTRRHACMHTCTINDKTERRGRRKMRTIWQDECVLTAAPAHCPHALLLWHMCQPTTVSFHGVQGSFRNDSREG